MHVPADVLFPDGLLSDDAVEEGVERLEQVVVRVDLVQGDRHYTQQTTKHTAAVKIFFFSKTNRKTAVSNTCCLNLPTCFV